REKARILRETTEISDISVCASDERRTVTRVSNDGVFIAFCYDLNRVVARKAPFSRSRLALRFAFGSPLTTRLRSRWSLGLTFPPGSRSLTASIRGLLHSVQSASPCSIGARMRLPHSVHEPS